MNRPFSGPVQNISKALFFKKETAIKVLKHLQNALIIHKENTKESNV